MLAVNLNDPAITACSKCFHLLGERRAQPVLLSTAYPTAPCCRRCGQPQPYFLCGMAVAAWAAATLGSNTRCKTLLGHNTAT